MPINNYNNYNITGANFRAVTDLMLQSHTLLFFFLFYI